MGIRDTVGELQMIRELDAEVSPHIDARMLAMARHIAEATPNGFLTVMTDDEVGARPDSIRHHLTRLGPNVTSSAEQLQTLGLVDLLLGEQSGEALGAFMEADRRFGITDMVKDGKTVVVPSNHLELPDQGLTLGTFGKLAHEQDFDRFENYATVMLGRLIGYFKLGETNVIDGLLRKAGTVLKTFPTLGGEVMDESSDGIEADNLSLFRRVCNNRTRHELDDIVESNTGQVVFLASGGAQDTRTGGRVYMQELSRGTCEMLSDACKKGALVVPLFVDYAPDKTLVEFAEPVIVDRPEDCHTDIGETIAAMGNRARGAASEHYPDIDRFAEPIIYGKN